MLKYYVADAFADNTFEGNPAGVCVLDEWPSHEKMQKIAMENNLSETGFVVMCPLPDRRNPYRRRLKPFHRDRLFVAP